MSPNRGNGNNGGRRWLRRAHRWMGIGLLLFVLFLSVSGIALNHAGGLELDRRYITWPWLLDAYGMTLPAPSGSFADAGHRATLVGERLFLDGRDIGQSARVISGMVVPGPMVVIGAEDSLYLLTRGGAFVEAVDLGPLLGGPIDRVGRIGERVVVQSAAGFFVSDADIVQFETRADVSGARWSVASMPDSRELAALGTAWRGRGVTVERLLLDLHSGRLFPKVGPVLLDAVAVLLIVLSLSGLVLSVVRKRKHRNGQRSCGRGSQSAGQPGDADLNTNNSQSH